MADLVLRGRCSIENGVDRRCARPAPIQTFGAAIDAGIGVGRGPVPMPRATVDPPPRGSRSDSNQPPKRDPYCMRIHTGRTG
jgi:hypothetical protein